MYAAALLVSSLFALVSARIYERCELARDLLKLGVRQEHIATWVCIAYHESRFDTAARNPSSGDHGLLQISELYWCGAGKACGIPCSALRDDDISDDVECALSIYEEHTRLQGNGFLAWVVYPHYCKHYAKKYLADCEMSLKDTNYKSEGRSRSFHRFNSYPTVNVNFTNPVQSASYPKSDESVPLFLSVVSLLRGKYEQDFERDYKKRPKVNWSRFKINNVDDLKVPDFNKIPDYGFLTPFTTRKPTTFLTTLPPEPQYKPVKPWRIIETNQFRRKMKVSSKIFTENNKNKSLNEISYVSSTLRPTTTVGTSTSIYNSQSIITVPTAMNVFEEVTEKSRPSCCVTTPFTTTTHSTTLIPSTSYSPATTAHKIYTNSQISYSNEAPPPNKTENHENKIKTFWENYSHLTSKSLDIKSISHTENPLKSYTTLSQHTTPKSDITGTSERPYLLTTKIDTHRDNALYSFDATPKGKETLFSTLSTNQFTTSKPQSYNSTTIKTWTRHQVQKHERLSTNIPKADARPDNSQKLTWRSFVETDQNLNGRRQFVNPLTTTRRTLSTTSKSVNINLDAKSATTVKNTLADTGLNIKSTTQSTLDTKTPVTTVRTTFTSPSIPKTTLSIFDLYLNPTKRPRIPNYKFLFSNNSNLKIFSGGTTPSPGKKNVP